LNKKNCILFLRENFRLNDKDIILILLNLYIVSKIYNVFVIVALESGNRKVIKVVNPHTQLNDKEHFFCEWIWMILLLLL